MLQILARVIDHFVGEDNVYRGQHFSSHPSFPVFGSKDLRDFLAENDRKIREEVEREAEDYILNVNEVTYIDALVEKYALRPLRIDFDRVSVRDYDKQIPAENLLFSNQSNKTYTRQVIVYYMPFTGDRWLLECRPSQSIMWTREVIIDSPFQIPRLPLGLGHTKEVHLEIERKQATEEHYVCFEILNLGQNTQEIAVEAQEIIEKIKTQLGYLSQEVNRYNTSFRGNVEGRFKARKQHFLDNRQILASLGVPIRKWNEVSETYAIPVPQIRKHIAIKPTVEVKGYTPEPMLDPSIYHAILQIIHDLGNVFEQLPSIYTGKGEEALRDLIILYLTPHFSMDGSVTGETFNKIGKTDILIRYKTSNVFIAECKFWEGKKHYLETISQLLGYLTWRDSKAAVVIFVRNKRFSAILQSVKEVTPNHSNYLGFVNEENQTWLNYRFNINGDPNREVKLAVLLFHLPMVYDEKFIRDVVQMHHEVVHDPDAKDPFGYRACPDCGNTELRRESAIYDDDWYYMIMCEECGWNQVTQ